jgi:hypothetical protein
MRHARSFANACNDGLPAAEVFRLAASTCRRVSELAHQAITL